MQNCRQRNIMYESTCTICNLDNDPEVKDKYKRFRMEKAVYVGELARSIYERAQEHRKDAADAKEDSHMYKHWRISHPELQEPPTFRIKVVQSFQDALSRQIGEAVRIDMRSENVLNSKSEYNRCRLPRLTINQEDWQKKDVTKETAAIDTAPVEAWEETSFSNELGEEAAAWRLMPASNTGKAEKRKKKSQKEDDVLPEGKRKRRKTEKVVNWGETELDEELDVEAGCSKMLPRMTLPMG